MRSCMRRLALAVVLCLIMIPVVTGTALAAAPTIAGISPNNGPDAGSTSVTIMGTGFSVGATVKFGSTPVTGITIHSSESITATSPEGYGDELVNVTVTSLSGTSTSVPKDQFAYDPQPVGPWLGLNGNTSSDPATHEYLGPANEFSQHNIDYDRSFELVAGQIPSEVEPDQGQPETYFEAQLKSAHEYGMIPVSTIEYKGYDREGFEYVADPEFPQARTKEEEEEGRNTIKGYAEGFVKSATAILKLVNEKYPGMPVLFEPMNEPWGYTTPQYNGKEYGNVVVEVLSKALKAGIPLSDIYVGATGKKWISGMYEAQPTLETEIQGWYLHPYGPPSGTHDENSEGIQSLPYVQDEMTSGQNNLIVSEVGYCDDELNKALENPPCHEEGEEGVQAATNLTTMLDNALPYREAGWLRALIVYSRNAGGWAMQEYPSQVLSKAGEALDAFANVFGWTWAVQSTPGPVEATASKLFDTSCTSSSACVAVGDSVQSGNDAALAERWNGTEWSVLWVPSPAGATASVLYGVSCTSSTACIAVGSYTNSSGVEVALAEIWNGSEWALQSAPDPTGATLTRLQGLSCTSSTACTAVGLYHNSSGVEVTLAETWNGTTWSIQSTPNPTGAKASALMSVSCTSSNACTAAQDYLNSSNVIVPLVERWNGTAWAEQAAVTPTGATNTKIHRVSCTSSTACSAVGVYTNSSGVEVTLAETWNGTTWSIQSTPNPTGATLSRLQGLSCTSSTACTAVGLYHNSSNVELTLAETWNGTTWSIQSTPNPAGSQATALNSVSCTSSSACTAVQDYLNSSSTIVTLAESSV
jgi:IPT/TIG domain